MMTDEVTIEGLREIQATLAALPGLADRDLARRLGDFIEAQPAKIQARASRAGKLARMASKSVRADRDREGGQIIAGGGTRLPTGHGTYSDVFFGAEFGGGSRPATRQFQPYEPKGYWFFPQLEQDEEQLESLLDEVADRIERVWAA